jgi:glycosyltransferase involved in cell wall biosynthesis
MFSIIMPIWNRADIAPRAITSILGQTYQNYELILIDDGSDDDLEEAVTPYLSDKVVLYRISHSGICTARNFGLQHARGDYIAYLDSDNTWFPQFLSVMRGALNNGDESKKVAYCRYNLYKKIPIINKIFLRGVKGEEFNFEKLLKRNYIDINTFVHARECLDTVGFFDETLKRLTDWDFIIRITAMYEPLFVPEILVNYYLNICDNSVSKTERYKIAFKKIREKNLGHMRKEDKKKII